MDSSVRRQQCIQVVEDLAVWLQIIPLTSATPCVVATQCMCTPHLSAPLLPPCPWLRPWSPACTAPSFHFSWRTILICSPKPSSQILPPLGQPPCLWMLGKACSLCHPRDCVGPEVPKAELVLCWLGFPRVQLPLVLFPFSVLDGKWLKERMNVCATEHGVGVHTCNPSPWEAEVRIWWF